MRYLSIFKTVERNVPPSVDEISRMEKLIEKCMREGTLISTEGCLPSALGARVRKSGDKVTVTDGPFTEAKELVGGFAILEARSKDHAVELAHEFLQAAGDGECEIRQIYTASDPTVGNYVEHAVELREQFARR